MTQHHWASAPRERRKGTQGTSNSSTGPLRLTPGPGASLCQDLTENPNMAHIPASNYTGYVVTYSTGGAMLINEQEQQLPGPEGSMPRV